MTHFDAEAASADATRWTEGNIFPNLFLNRLVNGIPRICASNEGIGATAKTTTVLYSGHREPQL
jgi:hypothetical protein